MRSFCKHFGRIFAPLVLLGLVVLPSISNAVITAAIPDTTAKRDSTIDIPIRLTGVNPADDIISAEINLTFDSGILSAGTPSAGGIASAWSVSSYSSSGQIKIAMAGADSLTGNGVLLTIPFTVSGSATPGDNCTIHFAKCQFNEGSVSSTIDDDTFTVWAEYSISGSVTYYGGSNPAVSDVIMTLSGQESGADTTNTGNYSFSGLWSGYNCTVTPSKTNTSNSSAVSAMDASEVLQHIVGTDTLDTNQETAGEVSDNGSLSAYDAALILRYAVGKIAHFDAGDWTFTPGSTNYTPLNSNQTSQNYTAILHGDVTGNWSGSKGFKFSSSTDTGSNRKLNVDAIVKRDVITDEVTELTVPNVIGSPGGKITVPIKARNINDVIATGMILKYDSDVLTATEVSATSLTADCLIEYRITAGEIKIALAGIEPLKSSGTLIVISFDVNESPRAVYSPLKLENVELNEGRITCEVRSGSFSTARGIQAVTSLSKEFALSGNYPNPFAHITTIHYQLPMQSEVSLVVYNATGQVIRSLVKDKQEAGYYNVKWDGKDEFGRAITDGVYFYKMQISTEANNYTSVNKMILLR